MKIVFCLVKNLGGNPALGVSTERLYWIDPLRKLGHEVYEFELDEYLKGRGLPSKDDDGKLLEFVNKVAPNWVFMNDWSNDTISKNTWEAISRICKTSDWFGDDNHRFYSYSLFKARYFTHPITCDFFAYDNYVQHGFDNVILSQWGSLDFDSIQEEEVNAYRYDVTFVGAFSPYRKFIYDFLTRHGLNVKFYGNGWGGRVNLGQMKNIFRTSKINLNPAKMAANYDLRYMLKSPARRFGSYLKDIVFRREPIVKQIKARYFEINACGGFQISEYSPMIEKYYDIGRELVVFSNPDDLLSLINYYLRRREEREQIAKRGRHKAINNHLMIQRLSEVINKIFG